MSFNSSYNGNRIDSRLITWRFFLNIRSNENTFIFVDSYNPNLLLMSSYANTLIICSDNKGVLAKFKDEVIGACLLNVVLVSIEDFALDVDPESVGVFICHLENSRSAKLSNDIHTLIFLFGKIKNCKQILFSMKNPFLSPVNKRRKIGFLVKILIGLIKINKLNKKNFDFIKKCGGLVSTVIYFSVGPVGESICIYSPNPNTCYRFYNANFTGVKGAVFLKKIINDFFVITGVAKVLSDEFLYLCRK